MAGLVGRGGFRPGSATCRQRAIREPQESAWRSAVGAQQARAAHLRGAPARRGPDDAARSRGRVRHLARARAADRSPRLPEDTEGGATTLVGDSLAEWPLICIFTAA